MKRRIWRDPGATRLPRKSGCRKDIQAQKPQSEGQLSIWPREKMGVTEVAGEKERELSGVFPGKTDHDLREMKCSPQCAELGNLQKVMGGAQGRGGKRHLFFSECFCPSN